jgi:hypothetical protein
MNRKEAIKKWEEIIIEIESKKQEVNNTFDTIRQKIDQLNNNINDANNKFATISSVEEQTKKRNEDSSQSFITIEKCRSDIEKFQLATKELLETNKELSEQIENQLGIAAGGSLSHTFNDRKTELGKSTKKWFWCLIIDILILAGVAFFVFLELKNNPALTPNFFLKFTLSFPFVYGAFFFHSQFNKEKQLLEEYAFKSAVSLSLEAYRQLLKGEIEEGQDKGKITEFMTKAIDKIYTSPRENIAIHPNKEDNVEVGILGEVADIFKKFINK